MSEQKSKSNGLAISGLIVGIFIPLVGLILSIIGLSKSKENGGKGLAIAGIIVSILVGMGQMALIGGAFKATDSANKEVSKATGTTNAEEDKSKTYRFNDRADKQSEDVELVISETGVVDGVKVTVSSANYMTSLNEYMSASEGKTYVKVNITLENNSDRAKPYNSFDFRIQTVGGQVLDPTFGAEEDLGSGDLVQGGKVSGDVYFEVPVEIGSQYLIWKPGLSADRAIVQLKV